MAWSPFDPCQTAFICQGGSLHTLQVADRPDAAGRLHVQVSVVTVVTCSSQISITSFALRMNIGSTQVQKAQSLSHTESASTLKLCTQSPPLGPLAPTTPFPPPPPSPPPPPTCHRAYQRCMMFQAHTVVQGGHAALSAAGSSRGRVSCQWTHPAKLACTAGRNLVQCQLAGAGRAGRVVLLHSRPEGDHFLGLATPSQVHCNQPYISLNL